MVNLQHIKERKKRQIWQGWARGPMSPVLDLRCSRPLTRAQAQGLFPSYTSLAAERIHICDPCWKATKKACNLEGKKIKIKMPARVYFRYVQAVPWKNNGFFFSFFSRTLMIPRNY